MMQASSLVIRMPLNYLWDQRKSNKSPLTIQQNNPLKKIYAYPKASPLYYEQVKQRFFDLVFFDARKTILI